MTEKYLGVGEVAKRFGWERSTVEGYIERGTMVAPDVMVGKIRGWSEETLDAWYRSRPGRGARTDLRR